MRAQNFLDVIYEFLTRRVVYHALFWTAFLSILMWLGTDEYTRLENQLRNELLSLAFYMSAVYINIRYLIPKYLARHAFFYLLSVVILTVLLTPIKVFVLYVLFSKNQLYQSLLVDNQMKLYVGMFFVVMFSTVLKILTDWWRYQQEKQKLITQSMQSELKFLRSQINPHFLFNTLNNLYSLTLSKNDKAPEVVIKLSEIMRYMLYESNEKRVPLEKEVSFLENYIALERLRLSKGSDVTFETEGEIGNQLIVPHLFVAFLENSFKHGLNRHLNEGGFVRISLKIHGEHLSFLIVNSKPHNLPDNMKPHQGGIGLRNIKSRLKMNYPFRHSLEIKDEPQIYTVNLELELNGFHNPE